MTNRRLKYLGTVHITEQQLATTGHNPAHAIMQALRDAGLDVQHTLDPFPGHDDVKILIIDAVTRAGGTSFITTRHPTGGITISWA